MIDVLLLLIFAVVTWMVASESTWGAVLTFLSVLFSGLLAMNFFEPTANFLKEQMPRADAYADILSLLGWFTVFVFAFRIGTEQMAPNLLQLDGPVDQGARWAFAAATGYLTAAILLTSMHTAPLPREFMGFRAERANLFNLLAPDRQWLGFTQHVSEKALFNGRLFDGPRFRMPGMMEDGYWPSFPIRYAQRRDLYARGPAALRTGAAGGVPSAPAGGTSGGAPATGGSGGPPPAGF